MQSNAARRHSAADSSAEPVHLPQRARPALHAVGARPELPEPQGVDAAAWQACCAARICACDASIDAGDASDLAAAMWTLERWQRMAPDAAVDALFGSADAR